MRPRPGDRRPAQRSRRALVWPIRILSATVAVAMMALAAYGFVLKSLPYHTPQFAPPRVRLTAQETSVVGRYPRGVPAVPVLTWRDISDRPGDLVTRPRQFAADLAVLHREGFHSIRLRTLQRLALGQPVTLPARPVVLTFDDGLSTDYTTVDPILRRYGFTGVVLVDPREIALKSPSYFLTRDELAAMAASRRWEIGLQMPVGRRTLGARPGIAGAPESLRAWRTRVVRATIRARSLLENVTGRPVMAFAWPVLSRVTPGALTAPRQLDSTLRPLFPVILARPAGGAARFVTAGQSHNALPRINITAADTLATLTARLREGIPGPPPADPAALPWSGAGEAHCSSMHHLVRITATSFALCTVVANGASWRSYELRFRLDIRGISTTDPRSPTALVELRMGKGGQIEIAIGRSVITVHQRIGSTWSLLHTATAFTGAPFPGQLPPLLGSGKLTVSLRLERRDLAVRVGAISFSVRVSGSLRAGVIGLGLLPAGHVRTMTYRDLELRFDARPAVVSPAMSQPSAQQGQPSAQQGQPGRRSA
jgi:poly-beta-1,6-N-acetyl-D-glucosamine N-deacetylase